MRHLPLLEREAALREVLPARGPAWCLAEPLDGSLDRILEVLAEHELEGLIAKRVDSRWYDGRRTRDWRKHKLRRRSEYLVAAWLPATDRQPETLLVRDGAGGLAGQVTIGPGVPEASELRNAIAERFEAPTRRKGPRRLRPGLVVTVDAHGPVGQPLRDPILRAWRTAQ